MFKVARVSSVIAVSTALICSVALPATAADSTDLTVTVLQGGLSISAPDVPPFADVTPGLAVTRTATMTDVTVTDNRGTTSTSLNRSWTASVELEDFTGKPGNTFPASAVTYLPGAATQKVGKIINPNDPLGALTDASLSVAAPATVAFPLGKAHTAQSASLIVGNNTVSWSPTLVLTVPDNAVPDTYTATLTHSVV